MKLLLLLYGSNAFLNSVLVENKFAVGSGAKTVCICYYEQENNWSVSVSFLFIPQVYLYPLNMMVMRGFLCLYPDCIKVCLDSSICIKVL